MPLKLKPYLQGLLSVLEPATCTALARVVRGVSHDCLSRILKNKKLEWQTLLSGLVSRISGKLQRGYLVIDDTVIDKSFAKLIENLSWIYSSKENRVVLGLNLVVLAWSNGVITLPLGVKIWKKGGKSKYDLAGELLWYAKKVLQIKPQYVVFDSWYASEKILSQLASYRWTFCCQLKRNRKLNGEPLRRLHSHPYWIERGTLTGGARVLVVRHGKKYFATNALALSKQETLARYKTRWVIETMFRLLHAELGLEACQSVSLRVQTAHIHLCLMTVAAVEKHAALTNRTRYEILRQCRFDNRWTENLLCYFAFEGA